MGTLQASISVSLFMGCGFGDSIYLPISLLLCPLCGIHAEQGTFNLERFNPEQEGRGEQGAGAYSGQEEIVI